MKPVFTSINEIVNACYNRANIIDTFVLKYPRNRHLHLFGLSNNPFKTFALMLWELGGTEYIDDTVKTFNPSLCTENGKSFRGACNTRLRKYNLYKHIIDTYKKHGINTSNACGSIWQPELDTQSEIARKIDTRTNEFPDECFLYTWIKDNQFNFKLSLIPQNVIDVPFSVFTFTVLQEMLYEYIKRELSLYDLKLGTYCHDALFLFAESKNREELCAVAWNDKNAHRTLYLNDESNFKIKIPKTMQLFEFTGQLYNAFNYCVKMTTKDEADEWLSCRFDGYDVVGFVNDFFNGAGCDKEYNSLYLYMLLPLLYLACNNLKTKQDKKIFLDILHQSGIILSIDIKKMIDMNF